MATVEQAPVPLGAKRRRGRTLAQQDSRAGLTLVSPTLIITLVMVVLPVAITIVLSLQRLRLSGVRDSGLVGETLTFRNFERLLSSSGFWDIVVTTVLYAMLGTAGSIALGLGAALVVREPFRGRTVARGLMLLPWVAPIVAVAFVWQVMLHPQFGVVNAIGTERLGWGDPIPFLSQKTGDISILGLNIGVPTALLVVIAFESWRYFPFAFLFILARLQALPSELDEAARMDGATPLQRFRYITLPQLASVIALLAVLRFIMTFSKFDDVYLLTGGGAGTQVLGVQVYDFLTARNDVGSSAAVAVVMALIMSLFLGIYLRWFAAPEEERA
jgi:multiple sugar transport system permease protein